MNNRVLKYSLVPGQFAICRLSAHEAIPDWALRGVFQSVTRTSDELSIVCPAENVPVGMAADAPWICFKLAGPFPFMEVGVLASFVGPLAKHGLPVFAIATFDTDYILIKEEFQDRAIDTLRQAGHELISG
ncbi:MAG TPA: ACT domain-containing protein [Candidatus Angelobacter sp.]|nr:ACT domain-containing protein [Candidatus Angelobacter sp.]